ncbi:MAG: hypothetical protein J0J04_07845 [Microbacterium sp.]|uniref:hypothetical protein n=1 Tax=Microbacterium sp. TaxID=51671 RepID=UPI001AC256C2|nr:hypothetical protein [Microbacterium sp.]MBN9214711.1 hypothetical protein [Microbacterium sp.]
MTTDARLQIDSTGDAITLSIVTTIAAEELTAEHAATRAEQILADIAAAADAGRTHVDMTIGTQKIQTDLARATLLAEYLLDQAAVTE